MQVDSAYSLKTLNVPRRFGLNIPNSADRTTDALDENTFARDCEDRRSLRPGEFGWNSLALVCQARRVG